MDSAYEARNRTERPHHTSKASHPMRRDWRPRMRLAEVEFGLSFGATQERSDEQTDQWGRTADTSRKNQKTWVSGWMGINMLVRQRRRLLTDTSHLE